MQPWAYHRFWQLYQEHFALLAMVSQQEIARLENIFWHGLGHLVALVHVPENISPNNFVVMMHLAEVDVWKFVALSFFWCALQGRGWKTPSKL